jgi:hypothetical protein
MMAQQDPLVQMAMMGQQVRPVHKALPVQTGMMEQLVRQEHKALQV